MLICKDRLEAYILCFSCWNGVLVLKSQIMKWYCENENRNLPQRILVKDDQNGGYMRLSNGMTWLTVILGNIFLTN